MLRQHLGAPESAAPAPQHPLPACVSQLSDVQQTEPGILTGFADNLAAALAFLDAYDEELGSKHSVTECNSRKNRRCERSCRHAGKPDGPNTKRFRVQAAAGCTKVRSSRKVGCTAKVIFWTCEDPKAKVRVEVRLIHTGHVVGADVDISNLPLHPRLVNTCVVRDDSLCSRRLCFIPGSLMAASVVCVFGLHLHIPAEHYGCGSVLYLVSSAMLSSHGSAQQTCLGHSANCSIMGHGATCQLASACQ